MSGGSMDYIYWKVEEAAKYVDDKEIKEWINEWKPFFLEWKTMHHYSPQCQEIESIIQKYERY